MAVWSDLPTEMTSEILHHLGDERDIVDAMLVCDRFRAILEPILYDEVTLYWRDVPECCSEPERLLGWECGQLRLFLRTILSRPKLGGRVHTLHIDAVSNSGGPERDMTAPAALRCDLCAMQVDPPRSGSYEVGDSDGTISAAATQRGIPIVLVHGAPGLMVLLLHHLSQLSSLSVYWCNKAVATLASAAAGHLKGGIPAGLQSLKCLNLLHDRDLEDACGFTISTVANFMTLPALSDFTVRGFGDYEKDKSERNYSNFGTSEVSHGLPSSGFSSSNPFVVVDSQLHPSPNLASHPTAAYGWPRRLQNHEPHSRPS